LNRPLGIKGVHSAVILSVVSAQAGVLREQRDTQFCNRTLAKVTSPTIVHDQVLDGRPEEYNFQPRQARAAIHQH